MPVLATVQPVLLKTSDHRILTQFLSLGSVRPLRLLFSRADRSIIQTNFISLRQDVASSMKVKLLSVASSLLRSNRGCLLENSVYRSMEK